jgi:hypothetical protein
VLEFAIELGFEFLELGDREGGQVDCRIVSWSCRIDWGGMGKKETYSAARLVDFVWTPWLWFGSCSGV